MGEEENEMEDLNEIEEWTKEFCKARTRLDQLALPNRRRILNLWQAYHCILPLDKQCFVKNLLEDLYPMTPEETQKYFGSIRTSQKKRSKQKATQAKLKKLYHKKHKSDQLAKSYEFFRKALKTGIQYAITHQVPPLVSARLRNLSNIVLEQICDILCCKVPDRYDDTKNCTFLIAVADWIAVAIERVYYIVHLKKNLEMEKIEEAEREKEKLKEKETVDTTEEIVIRTEQAEDDEIE